MSEYCNNCYDLSREIEYLILDVNEHLSTINELESQISDLTDDIERLTEFETLYAELTDAHETLISDNNDLDKKVDNYEYDIEDLKSSLSTEQDEKTELEKQWNEHLEYLEEYWPEVHFDMISRGVI